MGLSRLNGRLLNENQRMGCSMAHFNESEGQQVPLGEVQGEDGVLIGGRGGSG